VKDDGRLDVTAVSETEKRDDPLSLMFNKFPAVPLGPILTDSRSPVVVVDDPGVQSSESRPPDERAVDVEVRYKRFPIVKELAVKVLALAVVSAETVCRVEAGVVVPMPTLPEVSILIALTLVFVTNCS